VADSASRSSQANQEQHQRDRAQNGPNLENFESVRCLAEKTHPSVARSVALSACRAADPLTTARLYLQNYDAIVKRVSRTDARRAHMVAAQAFRSNNPMRWAKRYLAELHEAG
jgi:hypothetical protein